MFLGVLGGYMSIIAWIAVFIGLYGTYLNSNQNRRGFYFWIVSNIALAVVNLECGQMAQCVLFFIYTGLAVRGLARWK